MAFQTLSLERPETAARPIEEVPGDVLRLIPLGGFCEFGQNCACLEAAGERLLVDCGAMFPDADMPGVDLVIPDVSYLLDEPERLKGIVLTHAHEDHIGALPYVLDRIDAPVYGTRLTLAYVRAKLEEHGLAKTTELIELEYRRPVRVSEALRVEALSVTHSIPNAAAIAVHTPVGTVVHTGDYKIDHAPLVGEDFDFFRFAQLGEEGVLALVGDSTNANVPGATKTEGWVEEHLEPIFASSRRAIFCTSFSRSMQRFQLLMHLAEDFGRKVFVAGRSLERTFAIGQAQGYLTVPPGLVRPMDEILQTPPARRLVLATGSQGEPMSVMSRLATGEYRPVDVEENDTIIISARIIPGHLRAVTRLANHFCRRGARVFDQTCAEVHASGHAYGEEMKAMINFLRPRYVVPAHGERRQLMSHRDLALGMGYDPADVPILEPGDVLEISESECRRAGVIDAGRVLVDGKTVGETGEVVLRDRQHLSEDGMIIAILNVDHRTGKLLTAPEIVTRGFVYVDESEDLIDELRDKAREAFEACSQESREASDLMNTEIRAALRRHVRRKYKRFPLILPVVQEI